MSEVDTHIKIKVSGSTTTTSSVGIKVCVTCQKQMDAGGTLSHCPVDQTILMVAPADPLVGSEIADKYETTGLLGAGGWSLVYKAKQNSLHRHVALKVLHRHLVPDPEKVIRFQREAEAASQFSHPHIAGVFDYGVLPEGQPYMVLEYLEGRSLSDMIEKDGLLTPEEAVNICQQVCDGLKEAHEHNVIHRDIKPSNIYLTAGRHDVKILDFGLAKIMAPEEGAAPLSLTQTGHTIGTPAYMSPEQCLGLRLDPRSDIYSLGCVLYEALTGIRPFEGRDAFETMNLHMRSDVSFAGTKVHDSVPASLEALVMKALSKEPDDRYQTSQEMLEALAEVGEELAKRQKQMPFATFTRNVKRAWMRRSGRWRRSGLDFAIAGMVVATMGVVAWKFLSSHDAPPPQPQMLPPVESAVDVERAWKQSYSQGIHLMDQRKYADAVTQFMEAKPYAEKLGKADKRLVRTLENLILSGEKAGLTKDAQAFKAELKRLEATTLGLSFGTIDGNDAKIKYLTQVLTQKPAAKAVAEELARVLNKQAQLYFVAGETKQGNLVTEKALTVEKKLLGPLSPELACSISNRAYYLQQTGKVQKAEEAYKKALELRQKISGPDHDKDVAKSLHNLGDFYFGTGNNKLAEDYMRQAATVRAKALGETSDEYAWDLSNLGLIYLDAKRYPDAEKALSRVLEIRRQIFPAGNLEIGRSLNNLGLLHLRQNKLELAESEFKEALPIYEDNDNVDNDDALACASNLAQTYEQMGKLEPAAENYMRVYSALEREHPLDQRRKPIYERLLKIYDKLGQKDKAAELKAQEAVH